MARKKQAQPKVTSGRETSRRKRLNGKESLPPRLARPKAIATPRSTKRDPVVVGIGASAGGLEAFKKLFSAMPAQSGMAFVLIQHLDPTHESHMGHLLGKYTSMTVVEVKDQMPVEANRVYLNPPARYLSLHDGVLHLTERMERRGIRMPIDYFLHSLAENQQEKFIGIILSGTGTDGTLGLQDIKAHGGMAMVQDPETALYDGMPRSAIATGVVDHVLSLEQMPEALVKYVQHSHPGATRGPTALSEKAPADLTRILDFLRTQTQHDFRMYKKDPVMRCIERRVKLNHLNQAAGYLNFLRENPTEVRQLFQHLLIGTTGFFREPEAFKFLEEKVIPRLVEEKDAGTPFRVWVPGCATGEEAYSIAILLLERLSKARMSCNLQIFSTDIDEKALAFARKATYLEDIDAVVSPERLRRFFVKEGQSYQVKKQVRESVIFAMQNLVSDPPFSRLDLISCRNLLIYLEPKAQGKIISRFNLALNDHGYLFLGRSESTGQQDDLFRPVGKKWRIYRRVEPRRRGSADFPILPGVESHATLPGPEERSTSPTSVAGLIQQKLLEHYSPVWVLVNDNHRIVHFHGATGLYLEMPAGEPTLDVMSLARNGLRTKLRAALNQAIRDDETVIVDNAPIKRKGDCSDVKVTVRPVKGSKSVESLYLIIFENAPESSPPAMHGSNAPGSDERLVSQLKYELKFTKEELQRAIEQMEPSNQELKASNEEMMSMNEELQSTNEELATWVAQRTAFVKMLQDVAVIANEASSVDNAFLVVLERICRHMDWPVGHAYMSKNGDYQEFVDQGLWFLASPKRFRVLVELTRQTEFKLGVGMAGRVAAKGKPEWIRNVSEHEGFMHAEKVQDLGVRAAFAFPVLIRKRVVAVLEFFASEAAEPDEPLLEVMAHIGAQLGRVVERQRLQQELIDVVWQHQRQFGQELHDNLGQQLAGVAMMAKSLEQKLRTKSLLGPESARELLDGLKVAQMQVRSIAKGLFPVQVEAHGLMAGLEDLALTTKARHGVICTFDYEKPVPLKDNNTATHLFYIAQEAVTNAVIHGRAKQIVVGLKASCGFIELTVRDDGVGFHRDPDHREGTGLRIMEYRASLIGGTLDIAPAEGGGTVITCNLRQENRAAHEEH